MGYVKSSIHIYNLYLDINNYQLCQDIFYISDLLYRKNKFNIFKISIYNMKNQSRSCIIASRTSVDTATE